MTQDNLALALAVLLGISEALSLIPSIRANGILQGIFGILRKVAGK
jgi:hypothetical protein